MTPPEERHRYQEQIGAFLLGKLDGVELTAMQTHLSGCPVCQAEVRELEPVVAALADAAPDRIDEDPRPTGDLEELTLAPILGEIYRARSRRRRFRWSTQIAAAASVVVIGLAGFTLLDPEVSLAEGAVRLEIRMPGGDLVFSAKLTGPSAEKSDPADTQEKPKPDGSGSGTSPKERLPEIDDKRPSPGEKPGAAAKESERGSDLHESSPSGSPPPGSQPPGSPPPGSQPPGSPPPEPPPVNGQYPRR